MPLNPPVAEDILSLLDKHPDLTTVQKAILKSAAAYLVEDERDRMGNYDDTVDARLKLSFEEYEMVPDRIELWDGIPRPKHWETPNRLEAVRRENEEQHE